MRRTQSAERVSWRLTGYESCEEKPEGCLTFRVLSAQRVGIPKPIEASGDQHPTGRRKRSLGTANKAVKDTLLVPTRAIDSPVPP